MARDAHIQQIFTDCLAVNNHTLLIIYDTSSQDVMELLSHTAQAYTNAITCFNLDGVPRPANIQDIPLQADIIMFVASKYPGEVPLRSALRQKGTFRFAAMQGITTEILYDLWDQKQSWEYAQHIFANVRNAKHITIQSPAGTQLSITLGHHWICATSNLTTTPQRSYNIPGSEVYTCPKHIEGTAVIDGVLGDYFSSYGILSSTPLYLTIKQSHVTDVLCKNKQLQEKFKHYISSQLNGNRIGELGIGCAVGMKKLYGVMLADEKYPGCHIAVGNPYPALTGAEWSSTIHCDGVMLNPTIQVDEKILQ